MRSPVAGRIVSAGEELALVSAKSSGAPKSLTADFGSADLDDRIALHVNCPQAGCESWSGDSDAGGSVSRWHS
jgi:hypothetical protein